MICCEKCFRDSELISIIKSLNQIGDCEVCHKKGVFTYDTELDDNLVDNFIELLSIYTPVSSLPDNFPREKLSQLKYVLFEKWNIFNVGSEKIYNIVKHICSEKYVESPELFDTPVGILESNDNNYLEAHSILKTHEWEDFVREIRTQNRFHTKFINTEALKQLISYIEKPFNKGEILYRARISEEAGFPIGEMGAPPSEKASAGRVNPIGINYLYLANDHRTTLNEVRAGVYDYVTIGDFELKEDIMIIDFMLLDKVSPFTGNALQLAVNMEHLKKISNEIAKPLRRTDGPLDYLPTQYIADFIKSIKYDNGKSYDGIKYKSTLYEHGYNIAVFDESLFECKNVRVYDVNSIEYRYNPVNEQ